MQRHAPRGDGARLRGIDSRRHPQGPPPLRRSGHARVLPRDRRRAEARGDGEALPYHRRRGDGPRGPSPRGARGRGRAPRGVPRRGGEARRRRVPRHRGMGRPRGRPRRDLHRREEPPEVGIGRAWLRDREIPRPFDHPSRDPRARPADAPGRTLRHAAFGAFSGGDPHPEERIRQGDRLRHRLDALHSFRPLRSRGPRHQPALPPRARRRPRRGDHRELAPGGDREVGRRRAPRARRRERGEASRLAPSRAPRARTLRRGRRRSVGARARHDAREAPRARHRGDGDASPRHRRSRIHPRRGNGRRRPPRRDPPRHDGVARLPGAAPVR